MLKLYRLFSPVFLLRTALQALKFFCVHVVFFGVMHVHANTFVGHADLVVGNVRVYDGLVKTAVKQIKTGDAILEGQILQTGADGYLYINTIDKGFISLRPNTKVTIEIYRYNPTKLTDTQIRLNLHYGVIRSISGQGMQAARDKYRMNTPVAAIGIRGTDFTVLATQDITRATVRSGGITMSPLLNSCQAQALGPCEGASTVDLNAHKAEYLLQIRKGDRQPMLLDNPELRPDRLSPPRKDEIAKSSARLDDQEILKPAALSLSSATPLENIAAPNLLKMVLPKLETEYLQWGRWQALANLPATDIAAAITSNKEVVALAGPYLMTRDRIHLQIPSGSYQFKLQGYEAYFVNQQNRVSAAQITEPVLLVNFDKRSFVTSFMVSNTQQSVPVNAQGGITSDGKIVGDLFYVNATVRGALAGGNAEQAGFIFNRPIDGNNSAVGATRWSR
jgi:hypothetical protein